MGMPQAVTGLHFHRGLQLPDSETLSSVHKLMGFLTASSETSTVCWWHIALHWVGLAKMFVQVFP